MKETKDNYIKFVSNPDGSGNDFIEFSDEFIKDHGWNIDDTISFKPNKDGSVTIENLSLKEREKETKKTSSKKKTKKKS